MTVPAFARNRDAESNKTKALKRIEARCDQAQVSANARSGVVLTAAKRLSCVLGMLSSLEVKVLRPT